MLLLSHLVGPLLSTLPEMLVDAAELLDMCIIGAEHYALTVFLRVDMYVIIFIGFLAN